MRLKAIIERNGTRFGFLNYNCVGPKGQWATLIKPGCAYVISFHTTKIPIIREAYPDVYTFAEHRSLEAMEDDVRNLRPRCDVLVVVFHKGIRLSPKLAMYDREVSRAAIDAGADLVLGHHTLEKGIELYKGKAIFHGLGLFIPATKGSSEEQVRARRALFNLDISDTFFMQQYPAQYPAPHLAMIAKCVVDNRKISQVGFLPCLSLASKQPGRCSRTTRGGSRHLILWS